MEAEDEFLDENNEIISIDNIHDDLDDKIWCDMHDLYESPEIQTSANHMIDSLDAVNSAVN